MRSVQSAMLLAFSAIVLVTVVLMGVVSYSLAEDALVEVARQYTQQLVGQVRKGIDTYIDHMKDISEVVVRNSDVAALIDEGAGADSARQASELLASVQGTRDDIALMLVVDPDGTPIFHDDEYALNPAVEPRDTRWYREAVEAAGEPVVSSPHVQNAVHGRYPWVITLSRMIESDDRRGVFLVDLNFRVIEEMVQRLELGSRGYAFIVDAAGELVFHPQQQLIYSNLRSERVDDVMALEHGSFTVRGDAEPMHYTVELSDRTGWRIVGVNYVDELLYQRETLQWYYALWALVCFAAVILISILLAGQISRPLRALRESMKAVERGDFDVRLENRWNNEIGALAHDFNLMLETIDDLMRRNEHEQEQKRISELRALQNQITPHFLYNTLDSIIWMADGGHKDGVIEMTSALARLLRLSIRKGDELVSVQNEIEHVASYLRIQSIRYRDSLDYTVDVQPGTENYRTLKVILQPLVENAIYHGLRQRAGSGLVRIRCFRDDERLLFEVEDDGVGVDPHTVEELLRPSAAAANGGNGTSGANADTGSVGIRNVQERIRLYFGEQFGLSFARAAVAGTIVRIAQPLIPVDAHVQEAAR